MLVAWRLFQSAEQRGNGYTRNLKLNVRGQMFAP